MVVIMLFHVHLVATQIEIGVMQVIVERVAVTMEAMSHDYHVTYWGCKVFAHAASNGEKITLCRDYVCPLQSLEMRAIFCLDHFE